MEAYAGLGRIDEVTCAAVAHHILKHLEQNGALIRGVGENDVQGLAAYMERRKRMRFFDYRNKRIDDIDRLFFYLRSQGIIADASPRTVMELDDHWQYAFNQERACGLQPGLGISARMALVRIATKGAYANTVVTDTSRSYISDLKSRYDWEWLEESSAYVDPYQAYSQARGIAFIRHKKPLDMIGQYSAHYRCGVGLRRIYRLRRFPDKRTRLLDAPVCAIDMSHTLRLYPSIRSTLQFNNTFSFQYLFADTTVDMSYYIDDDVESVLMDKIYARASYFISPRFSISIHAETRIHFPLYNNGSHGLLSNHISLRMTYQFF
jgi:hypothetical protein